MSTILPIIKPLKRNLNQIVLQGTLIFLFSCGGQIPKQKDKVESDSSLVQKNIWGRKVKSDGLFSDIVRRIFQDKKGGFWLGTNSDGVFYFNGDSLVNYSTADGLSGDQVTAILEDKRSVIWIATNGGISTYDGKSFVNFCTKEGLPILAVQSIFQDRSGRMWFGGGGGVYNFDGKKFTHITTHGPWN